MSKLEEAGHIEVMREFVDRKSVTMLRLTAECRAAFLKYRESMTRVADAAG